MAVFHSLNVFKTSLKTSSRRVTLKKLNKSVVDKWLKWRVLEHPFGRLALLLSKSVKFIEK